MRICLILFCSLVLLASSCNQGPVGLSSPDKEISVEISVSDGDSVQYSVTYRDRMVIDNSFMGLEFSSGKSSGHDVKITSVQSGSRDQSWKPVYGERSEYPDRYNEKIITLTDIHSGEERGSITFRAFNEGIAFRYMVPGITDTLVTMENTQFALPPESRAWVSLRAQAQIMKKAINEITEPVERPVLVEIDSNTYLALGEAALVDFPRMKFICDPLKDCALNASLAGEAVISAGTESPWRYIMLAESPAKLLENNFILLNLNQPNMIENTSWIRPGKVIREVTLTTQGGMACVDFAARNNLQYIEFDAGWYGPEYNDTSDATTVAVDPGRSPGPLDLKGVIEYADHKGIGVILYVNRRALEKQIDEILPLYKSWGISGVKYGFVQVGSQQWTAWLHEAVRKAAENELMIDIHDEYRPTGYSRTYPNLMTQEGVRGDEESPDNEMVLNTLFTRMIAGAADHTNCYFASRVDERMGSHASQLAKAILMYSPWQFLFWYDRPEGSPGRSGGAGGSTGFIRDVPELEFYSRIPTVWEETRVLEGYPGRHATIARKSGESWFIGAINGLTDHRVDVELGFLDPEKQYEAVIYTDDPSLETLTRVHIEQVSVNSTSRIVKDIARNNGMAVIISPL
jgi:alpha-glucosidase